MTSEQAERQADASRQDLERDVEALKAKMTPGQLLDEATRMMGGAGQQVFSKFVDQAKENPMPLAVMGVGLAWLMASNNRSPAPAAYGRYAPTAYGGPSTLGEDLTGQARSQGAGVSGRAHAMGDKASAAAHDAKAKAGGFAHDAADKAKGAISDAKDRMREGAGHTMDRGRSAMHEIGDTAGSAMDRAGEFTHEAQRRVTSAFESEPLLLGAIGLAVGVALGAALPSTDVEDRTFGDARDDVVDRGKAAAREGVEQAKGAAKDAVTSAKDQLERSDGRDLKDKVADAAKAGRDAAEDRMARPH